MMSKEKKDKHFLKKPIYPGGRSAMMAFIGKHKKYPAEAAEKGIEGTVSLKYTIDHKGRVIDTHIISGLGHGCDEEAIRLVKMLKFEVPKTHKVRVQFHKEIHIHFRKPKSVPQKQANIAYHYTPDPTDTPQEESYNYTVTVGKQD